MAPELVALVSLLVVAIVAATGSAVVVSHRQACAVERRGRYSRAPGLDRDVLSAGRRATSAAIVRDLAETTERWGLAVLRHEITDVSRNRKE